MTGSRTFALLVLTVLVSTALSPYLVSSPSFADERSVRVGVYENPPIVFADDSGGFSGLAVEMLQEVASAEHWRLEYVFGSLSECLERLERGEIDVQVYIAYSEERARIYDFSRETLLSNWGVIYTRPGSGVETILDLEGRRVALMKNSIHPPVFMKLVESFGVSIEVVSIDNHSDGFGLVRDGNADAVVANRIFGLSNAQRFNLQETTIIFNPIEIRYAAPKGRNGQLLAAIDTRLKAMKADRESVFYRSFNKAFGLDAPFAAVSRWIYWGFFLLVGLAGFLGVVNSVLNRRVRIRTAELHDEIEAREHAEKALKESETRLRTLIKTIPDLVWLKDRDGVYLFCNYKFERFYGAPEQDIIGKTDYDFVDRDQADSFREHDRGAMASGKPAVNEEEVAFADDGHREMLETVKTPVFDSEGQIIGVLGIARDITNLKLSEKALRDSEEKYRILFDTFPLGITVTDPSGRIVETNDTAVRLLGVPREEQESRRIDGTGWPFVQADGTPMPPDDYPSVRALKENRRIDNVEIGINKADGETNWLSVTAAPFNLDRFGVVVAYVDITDRKNSEQEKIALQGQLSQAQKMESLGSLAGGIAHDFNNILFPIVGMSELLLEELPWDSPGRESVQQILTAGRRGSDLVRQILSFSRRAEHRMIPVKLQQVVKEALKLSRSTIPTGIRITQDLQSNCGLILANPTQLHQIAMNLVTNAHHAVEDPGGVIEVRVGEAALDGNEWKDSHLQPGSYALLSVTDNGHGIPRAIMDKIFDPYFTTKEKGKGTGLGLAVVYGIVKEHHGDIRVFSEVGRGTTIDVYFPLMEKTAQPLSAEWFEGASTGNESILLIDDEAPVVKVVTKMLESLGYKVTGKTSSVDALMTFMDDPQAFDLVISDMSMPGMTGDQLAMELMSVRPDIPIVICTGFSEKLNREKAVLIGVKGFLMKPVPRSEMAKMVRKVLDEA